MKYALILSVLILTSCGKLRTRPPEGELCVIYLADQVLLCQDIQDEKKESEIPLVEADRYIAVSPQTWAEVDRFIKELKQEARQRCR